jgi:hypothetical protein
MRFVSELEVVGKKGWPGRAHQPQPARTWDPQALQTRLARPSGYAPSPVFQDLHLLSLPLSIDPLDSSSPLIYIYREIACFLMCLFPLSSYHSLSQLFAYHSLFTINTQRFIASIHFRSEPERLQSITPISINQQQYIKQQS